MPQSLDELLRAARASLTSADAFDASVRQDQADETARGAHYDELATPHPVREFARGAGDAASRVGHTALEDLGHAAMGFGQMLTTPAATTAAELASTLTGSYIRGGAGEAGLDVAEQASGFPLRTIKNDWDQGNYPEVAGHVAAGGLAALLAHKAFGGPGESRRPVPRVPDFAGGERNPGSVRPDPFGPEPAPRAPVKYDGAKPKTLKDVFDPHAYDVPASGVGNVLGRYNDVVADRTPYRVPAEADVAGATYTPPADGLDARMPNRGNVSHPTDPHGGALPNDTGIDPYMSNAGNASHAADPDAGALSYKELHELFGTRSVLDPPAEYTPESAPSSVPDSGIENAPSARYAFEQDDFNGGSFPLYHIEGGPLHGSTVGAATLAEHGIPVPEPVAESAPAPTSPLSRLLKPRIPASVAAQAMDRGEPILDSPATAVGMRELDRGGGSYGLSDTEDAGAAQEAHRGNRMLDQGYQQRLEETYPPDWQTRLAARMRGEGGDPPAPVTPESAPTPPELTSGPGEPPAVPPQAAPDAVSAPSSLAELLQRSIDQQEADKASRVAAVTPPVEGGRRFTLPKPKAASNEAFLAARERMGIAPSPLERADRPVGALPDEAPGLGANADGVVEMHGGLGLAGDTTEALKGLATPEGRTKAGAWLQARQAANLLFSPLTVGRIAISNTAASLLKSLEYAADEKSLAPVGRTLKELFNLKQMGRDAVDAFRTPDEHGRLDTREQAATGPLSWGVRAVGAVDRPFRNAVERAGMSSEDALSVTQQRRPITEWGRGTVDYQQRHALTRLLIPFAKSGVNALEMGLVEPAQSIGKILGGEATGRDYVKPVAAAGAAVAGYEGNHALDEMGAPSWLKRLTFALTGQYEVPAALAQAAAESTGADDFFKRAVRNLPVIGSGLDLSVKGQMHRTVPAALNPDYWTGTQRETHNVGEQIQAQIPGLAQLLRAKRPARGTRAGRKPR